jgi:sugar-specific transcriptional regulator TrmB|tara:strand:+ start:5793 stop:6536 length:744 start_codon:yes stop_codon:yes gene_type:complete
MNTKILEKIGLTKNEIAIYLFLLKKEESTTGPIIKETKIANSRVYESLNSLLKKGLVSYNIQKDGKHFKAVNPKILLENQKDIENKIKLLIPELSSMKIPKKDETTMAIYEGFNGFKTAFAKIIDDCPKNEEIKITGFPEEIYEMEQLRDFLINMNLKSANKKQRLKILLEISVKKTLGKDREKEKFTEVRYMPEGYISPAAMDIFEDYVYIFLWEEKPYVFMIKNKKIADSFKSYHEFLWKIAKRL